MPETMPSSTVIEAHAVCKEVTSPEGSLTILDGIDLDIKAGEAVAIVGASGSGKSTLLGLLAGLDTPSRGRIAIEGTEIAQLDEDSRARLRAGRVGFVFQAFHLLPNLTALENVMLPLELGQHESAEARAQDFLERVGLGARLHHYPKQLSGGEQQRVAIARAFAIEPTILFADEPTGNLDSQTGHRIEELLFELNQERGTTLVLITHDERLAERCHRILHLDEGRMVDAA
ncbi:MAG: ABC transporter ATP-binding protein [Gammaproteobacteria bacterium]|nr:ABC transporter ATP-binding protein [Gammaproteobacteria bacterium]